MQNETEIALANLDWLMMHKGMRLDYGARVVLAADHWSPVLTLDDLAVEGLTPATVQWEGRAPIAICYAAATSPLDPPARIMRKPYFHRTEGMMDHVELAEEKPRGHTDPGER